mgnify:FL=1
MDKELAKRLTFLVADKNILDELTLYLNDRIEWNKQQLVSASDMETVRKHQGAIKELIELTYLRTKVLSTLGKLDEKGNPKISSR